MKTDMELLLEASHKMLRLKDEAKLNAAVIGEQSKLIVSQRKEIALLHARLSAADVQLRRAARSLDDHLAGVIATESNKIPALLRRQAE